MCSPKLFRYFNGTIISTFCVSPFPVGPVIFCLSLNEILLLSLTRKSIILLLLSGAVSSLCYYHKLPDVFE